MVGRTRKKNQYRRKGQSLIAANKIKPEQWQISNVEAKEALKAFGCKVQEIKKIRSLKHQVCISYWDEKGNVCSGFFSYRIFARWQREVSKLIDCCQTLEQWHTLNHIMRYEFAYYPYLRDMEDALHIALENRLCVLKVTVRQAVSPEWGVGKRRSGGTSVQEWGVGGDEEDEEDKEVMKVMEVMEVKLTDSSPSSPPTPPTPYSLFPTPLKINC